MKINDDGMCCVIYHEHNFLYSLIYVCFFIHKVNRNKTNQFFLPATTEVLFTYSVEWEESDIGWASRWDIYLAMSDVQIHWFSIINSVVVVFFLSGKNFL